MREKSYKEEKNKSYSNTIRGGESKVMKKNLSKLLASSLVVSSLVTPVAVLAEDSAAAASYPDVKATDWFATWVQQAADNGLMSGFPDGNFNPSGELNRAQLAVIMVNTLGLELNEEASADFADLGGYDWAKGYIGAAVEAGVFAGTGEGTFSPGLAVDRQTLATVLVKSLGFEEDAKLLDLAPDFDDADSIADWASAFVGFASSIKVDGKALMEGTGSNFAPTAKATRAEAAVVAVKYFQDELEYKEAGDALVDELTSVFEVSSVASVDNDRVEVTLKEEVSSVEAADFSIADADGKAVNVKAVNLQGDGVHVYVDTDALTPGASYTLTAGTVSKTFVSKPADSVKPSVTTVESLFSSVVKVTFADTGLDTDTALTPSNYTIKDASGNVLAVTNASFGDTRGIVVLTTAVQKGGELYTLTTSNVQDKAGNVIDSTVSNQFAGIAADATKPEVSGVEVKSNTKLEVTFTEIGTLDPVTALDVSNYTFDNGLTAVKAEFKKDSDGVVINQFSQQPIVVLTTSAQTGGTLYTMTYQNIKDATGNVIVKGTSLFAGVAADTTGPTISSVVATSNNKVRIQFNEALDAASAAVAANYTFDNSLTVVSAELDATDTDNKTVIVTTSAQTASTLYKVTVANVKNETGIVVKTGTGDSELFAGVAVDTTAPTISSVVPTDNSTVVVTFNEDVSKEEAQNVLNYKFDNSLGYPTSATRSSADHKVVTLKTAPQSSVVYTLTINNVQNEAGLKIAADSKSTFGGIAQTSAAVKLNSVVALNENVIRVTYNQSVDNGLATTLANYIVTSNKAGANAEADNIAYATTAGTSNLDDKFTDATDIEIVSVDAEQTTYDIVFKTAKAKSGSVYTVKVAGIAGKYGKPAGTAAELTKTFAGTPTVKPDVTAVAVTATYEDQIKITFSEPIDKTSLTDANITVYNGSATNTATLIGTGASSTLSSDGKTLTLNLTLNGANKIESNKVYYVELNQGGVASGLTDASKLFPIKVSATASTAERGFATGTVAAATANIPKVVSAVMTDVNTVKVKFSTAVANNGAVDADWNIYPTAADAAAGTNPILAVGDQVDTISVSSSDPTLVTFKFTKALTGAANNVYTFKLLDTTAIRSAVGANNTAATDVTSNFAISTAENPKAQIATATVVADDKLLVTFSRALSADVKGNLKIKNKTTGIVISDLDPGVVIADQSGATSFDEYLVTLTNGVFAAGTQYEVYVDAANTATASDGIAAILEDVVGTAALEGSTIAAGTASAPASTLALVSNANIMIDGDKVGATADAAGTIQDTITITADANLAASANYVLKFAAGTDALDVTQFAFTTTASALATSDITGSLLGSGGGTVVVTIHDAAGNLLSASPITVTIAN